MQLTDDGETTVSTIRIVTDGVRYSFQQWDEKGESDWRVLTDTKTKQTNYIYDDFVLRKTQSDSMTSEGSPDYLKQLSMSGDSRHLNMPMTVGTTMVDGTLYYSETYEESVGGARESLSTALMREISREEISGMSSKKGLTWALRGCKKQQ